MPDTTKRPWLILLPLACLVLVAALWSIYWYAAAGFARDAVARERQKLQSADVTLNCTRETWGGFPFRFEFTCTSPILLLGNRREIRTGNLLAVALAYNPWQVVFLIDGPSSATGFGPIPLQARHERAIISLTLGKDNLPVVAAEVPRLQIKDILTIDRLRLDSRPLAAAGVEIAASADRLNVQPVGRPELRIERSDAHGFLTPERRLTLERIELAQGAVRYWGKGEVHLDDDRRLSGKLSTETNDLDGLLAILEPHLDMTVDQQAGLRTMLGLLGKETKADVIALDGQLFIGPFKIADLLPLY